MQLSLAPEFLQKLGADPRPPSQSRHSRTPLDMTMPQYIIAHAVLGNIKGALNFCLIKEPMSPSRDVGGSPNVCYRCFHDRAYLYITNPIRFNFIHGLYITVTRISAALITSARTSRSSWPPHSFAAIPTNKQRTIRCIPKHSSSRR